MSPDSFMFYDGFEKLSRQCSFLQSEVALMGPTRERFTKTSLIIHGLVGDTNNILEDVVGNLPVDYAWFIISRFGA
jgi:hypothetical protein